MNPIEKIEELKENYRKNLYKKTDKIIQMYSFALNDGFTYDLFYEFYRSIHSLVGSGKTFGYVEISDKARELENELKSYIYEKKTPSLTKIKEFENLINSLIKVCNAI